MHDIVEHADACWLLAADECLSLLHNLPGQNGLEVCPGRETNARTALQTAWTDMDPVPGAPPSYLTGRRSS